MDIQQMQQQLINKISAVKDEDILQMLDEELNLSLQSHTDLSAVLDADDLQELTTLANEPIDRNTISLNEFDKIMDQWFMK
jgi:hypothetical protein